MHNELEMSSVIIQEIKIVFWAKVELSYLGRIYEKKEKERNVGCQVVPNSVTEVYVSCNFALDSYYG